MKNFITRFFFTTEAIVAACDITLIVTTGLRLTFADYLTLVGVVLFLIGPLLNLLNLGRTQ